MAGDWVPRVFETLGYLFAPADPAWPSRIITAERDWRPPADLTRPSADAGEVVIWGRPPDHDRPRLGSLPRAVRRELAIAALSVRPPRGLRVIRVQRLPPSPRPTRLQEVVRELVHSGAAVELHVAGSGGEARDRVLDAVVRAAGGSADRPRVRPSGDGSARVRLILGDGRPAELRVTRLGGLKHPARGHEALVALAAAGAALVPRPIGSGEIAGAAWTTETVLQGRLAARLTPAIAHDLVRFTVQLRTEGRPRSIGLNVAALAEAFPRHADVLRRTAVAAEGWGANLPTVLLHGDLWLGNLLVDGGRLSGVVDWDTWHPAGVAGTDLLNVVAMAERRRRDRDVGPLWLEEIWSSPAFADLAGPYWRALGLAAPDRAALAVIGLDWWANSVVGAARRGRGAWRDPAWIGRNVDDVAAGLEMLLAEVGGA